MTDTDDRRKNPSPPPVRRLFFANIAPGRPYHAALSATERAKAHGMRVTEHCHDFYEMLLVLAGEAVHGINGIETPLRAGDLILLRPDDRHYIRFQTGRHFYYINIAVDADMWHGFHTLTGAEKPLDAPIVRPAAVKTVPLAQDEPPDECAAAFRRALSLTTRRTILLTACRTTPRRG
jgi:mannose-6-phosphate isomerase-like protein (cupin superfamily)